MNRLPLLLAVLWVLCGPVEAMAQLNRAAAKVAQGVEEPAGKEDRKLQLLTESPEARQRRLEEAERAQAQAALEALQKQQQAQQLRQEALEDYRTHWVRVTLLRYVVHAEDDGLGGEGVDLYLGYMASEQVQALAIKLGGHTALPLDLPAAKPQWQPKAGGVHGTTQVLEGRQSTNGGSPRNTHQVNTILFEAPVDASGQAVRLNLYESDGTTEQVRRAYERAVVPSVQQAGIDVSGRDIASFFLVPFAPIAELVTMLNTDDTYGQWDLGIARAAGGGYQVQVGGDATPAQFAVPAGGSAETTLRFLDPQNDIEAIVRIESIAL